MNTWVKPVPHAARQRTPMEAIYARVVAELECLVDAETYDEKYHLGEVMQAAMVIAGRWSEDAFAWDAAARGAIFMLAEGKLLDLLNDGDDCALGKVLREATIKEFASDCFNAAEEEFGL